MDSPSVVRDLVRGWPDAQRELAARLAAKYGEPQEATPTRLIWLDNRPWKHTMLHRDGPRHDFPFPHYDVLEQTIDYRVPPDKVGDLLRFNGSLIVARTAGELRSLCSEEPYNFLAINLADEICTGRADLETARSRYIADIRLLYRGETTVLSRGFTFSVMRGGTGDPDVAVL